MKKFNLSIFIFLLSSFISNSLKAQTTYISFEDKTVSGITLQSGSDMRNAKYIIQIKNSETIKYTPDDLKSYQLRDGRLYVAREITDSKNDKVFLEVLVNGSYKLFYYKGEGLKKYFYSKPGSEELHELTQQNLPDLRDELTTNTDCDEIRDAFKFIKVQRNSLIRFFEGLKDCDFFPYHRLKFGVNVGLSQIRLLDPTKINTINGEFRRYDSDYNFNFRFGLFLEIPIDLTKGKIVTGVNYISHKGIAIYNVAGGFQIADISFSAINLPLNFKFNIKDHKKFRPFFQLGVSYDHLFENSNDIFLSNGYYGFLMGVGTEFNINYRSEIRTQINYSYKIGGENALDMSTFNYSISYIF